jgi:hypothetical protein
MTPLITLASPMMLPLTMTQLLEGHDLPVGGRG